MISSAILDRYAQSLADVAAQTNEEDAAGKDLELYKDIFLAAPDVLEVFHSPSIPRENKEKALSELLAVYPVRPTTANFLRVLLKHNRIRYFQQIHDSYCAILSKRKGIVDAKVTVAVPLQPQDIASLRDRLDKATGKTVSLDVQHNPNLLGGIIVQIGSTVYDGSVRTKLAEMKRQLTESSP
jgi:F-type H+-transporting ATPase subunit delta